MPGHFTHIYTQRQVAAWLAGKTSFNPDDVADTGAGAPPLQGGFLGIDAARASELMEKWPTFAAVGAIGPDLFFFCQDYSSGPLAEFQFQDDLLMLAMRVAYWVDEARDENYEPLIVLLAEVNQTFANIVRLLLKLQKVWDEFVAGWNATIGPFVDAAGSLLNDLSGGVLDSIGTVFDQLVNALEQVAIEELATFADVFSWFSLKMRVGWDEQSFVWSDMLHYRKTNQMARALLEEARRQFDEDKDETKFEQFQAFALGWVCHVGTDVVAHSFVNEQCGGPFRTHWQRHHLIENHIDAWNYRQAGTVGGTTGTLPQDPIAGNDNYPDVGVSAMAFAVALDPDHSQQHNTDNASQFGWQQTSDGWQRPDDANSASDPKSAVDVDGELPDWLAEGIVRALIATYHDGGPEPQNLGGSAFQAGSSTVIGLLETLLNTAGVDVNEPLDQLVAQLAPTPSFDVPAGYPLPWEVQVSYRFMITYYKFAFWSSFNLDAPPPPDVIIWPPASDFTNLASPPDFSGVNSDDPIEDICDAILAILSWFFKELAAGIQLIGDLIQAVLSPATYPIRLGLWQLAMNIWDVVSTTHDILAHTGFMLPHGLVLDSDGNLQLANEIDHGLISLGNSLDASFAQALLDATDPFGNLDKNPALLIPPHNPRDRRYPFFPVRDHQLASGTVNEFRRPWAYPSNSTNYPTQPENVYNTPGELSDIRAELDNAGLVDEFEGISRVTGPFAGTVSGPYPQGATPDQVFFRTGRPVNPAQRELYEKAPTPAHTDVLNERLIGREAETDHSPLGDPVQLCGYLMGQALSKQYGYGVDFNLDADRGYGYRCWDWIRGTATGTNQRGQTYDLPVVAPDGAEADPPWYPAPPQQWPGAAPDATQVPIQLHYLEDKVGD